MTRVVKYRRISRDVIYKNYMLQIHHLIAHFQIVRNTNVYERAQSQQHSNCCYRACVVIRFVQPSIGHVTCTIEYD